MNTGKKAFAILAILAWKRAFRLWFDTIAVDVDRESRVMKRQI
jgi:hypothetical protein